MNNLLHLFNMGGYGLYVWPAYCITLVVFSLNLFIFFHEKKQVKKIIKNYLNES